MVRVTNAVASRRRRKRILKLSKGFVGDRKNHRCVTKDAVMKALSYKFIHRKNKKSDIRSLWITRINVAAKMQGISYSKLISGLKKGGSLINRKMLAHMAMNDMNGFQEVVSVAKKALV
ncbi:MAG: 50S ribosomal protein L20 [Chlamydiota bacterium]